MEKKKAREKIPKLRGSSSHAKKCKDKHVCSGVEVRDKKLGNYCCVHNSDCKRPSLVTMWGKH